MRRLAWASLPATLTVAAFTSTYAPRSVACAVCLSHDDVVPPGPPSRREPVPQNLRAFVVDEWTDAGADALAFHVRADGGWVAVPTIVEEDEQGAKGFWLRLVSPLPEGTVVRSPRSQLTVGGRTDDTPPTVPQVTLRGASGGLCCSSVNVGVEATASVDDGEQPPQTLRITVHDDVSTRSTLFAYFPGMHLPFGAGDCLRTDPLAVAGSSGELFVSAIDWAGHESSVVGPLSFTYEEAQQAGCPAPVPNRDVPSCAASSATGLLAPGAALLAIAAVAGRMRRRG